MSRSVVDILAARFAVSARPGAKVDCPSCGRHTFSVNSNDTIATCFHPSCGKRITAGGDADCPAIVNVLGRLFDESHAALMAQASGSSSSDAYHYLCDGRLIHPQVIADSMLGIIPGASSIDALFEPDIKALQADADAEAKQKRPPGRPSKNPPPSAAATMEELREQKLKLAELLGKAAGWLAFFYTDAAGRIVSVRLRKPFDKVFMAFKPLANAGLFNQHVFAPHTDPTILVDPSDGAMVVGEGEFNVLQLQSLRARQAESAGIPPSCGYLTACAVGGVSNADTAALAVVAAGQPLLICYDNDESGAGEQLVAAVRQKTAVRACTTPEPDSDLDFFLRAFGTDDAAAVTALEQRFRGAELVVRPFDAVALEIDGHRRSGGMDFEIRRAVAGAVVHDLSSRAGFYHDGQLAYLFLRDSKELIQISDESRDLMLLLGRYRVAPGEELFRHIYDALWMEASNKGTRTDVHVFSHYREGTRPAVYLCGGGKVV